MGINFYSMNNNTQSFMIDEKEENTIDYTQGFMIDEKEENTIDYTQKFILDEESEKNQYQQILNDEKCNITKEQFTYDKMGRALITIWYEEED